MITLNARMQNESWIVQEISAAHPYWDYFTWLPGLIYGEVEYNVIAVKANACQFQIE